MAMTRQAGQWSVTADDVAWFSELTKAVRLTADDNGDGFV